MIIGIGLPRTGTRTLAKALEILGYNGSHHCELIGTTKDRDENDSFIIDNSSYHSFKNLNKNNIYIMTYRQPEKWRKSVFQFSEYKGPDIEAYKYRCINMLQKENIKFLILDIVEGWEPLCEFLGKIKPDSNFPFEK